MKKNFKLEVLSLFWGKSGKLNLDYIKGRTLWYSYRKDFASLGDNTYMDLPFTLRGCEFISIGNNFHACRGCRIQAWEKYEGAKYTPLIKIGNNVSINMNVDISCINEIVIGDGVQMASNILITDHFHGRINSDTLELPPSKRVLYSKGPIIIGDNVWIGSNAAIMPNVCIGENAIIGANTVVTHDIPANAVCVGNGSARIINYL